jgi:hypothetical protein
MRIQTAVLLALTVSATVAKAILGLEENQIAPSPGAIQASVNATSISNIMQTFVPIMAYFALNNHTFDIDVHEKSWLYSFDFNSMHIIEAGGFTTKIFEYLPGTDILHVQIGGVNVSSTIDADLKAIEVINFKSSGVNITNLNLDIKLRSTTPDNLHWDLIETVAVTFDKVDISMASPALDYLVKLSSSIINKVIKSVVVPAAEGYFTNIVKNLNTMIANEGPMDFEVPLGSDNKTALNLTMTTAPAMVAGSDLIVINFDGLVDKMVGVSNKELRGDIAEYAPRLQHSNSEQFWIHEDTFNSVIKNANSMLFPMDLTTDNIVNEFFTAIPELKAYYGDSAKGSVALNMHAGLAGKAVTFDMENGVTVGAGATTTVDFTVTNSTNADALALRFSSKVVMNSPSYLKNLVLFPSVSDIECSGTRLTHSFIDLKLNATDLNTKFSEIINKASKDFNANLKMGFPLANLNPQLGMLGGILKNTTMSTQVTNGYMNLGFEMQADLPNAMAPVETGYELKFLE